MNLVVMQNRTAVTSSLVVAETFEKRHDHVLRDVEKLKKDVPNFGEMFFEGKEEDSYGRDRKVYYMNFKGFTILAMGFTGDKAVQFKLKYIDEFERMENQLKNPVSLTAREQLQLLMQGNEEVNQRVDVIENDLNDLKHNMRLDGTEQFEIHSKGQKKIIDLLGGMNSKVYKELSGKAYKQFWGEFKRYFNIPRYSELKKVDVNKALNFIECWRPNTALQMEINALENQLDLFN